MCLSLNPSRCGRDLPRRQESVFQRRALLVDLWHLFGSGVGEAWGVTLMCFCLSILYGERFTLQVGGPEVQAAVLESLPSQGRKKAVVPFRVNRYEGLLSRGIPLVSKTVSNLPISNQSWNWGSLWATIPYCRPSLGS